MRPPGVEKTKLGVEAVYVPHVQVIMILMIIEVIVIMIIMIVLDHHNTRYRY